MMISRNVNRNETAEIFRKIMEVLQKVREMYIFLQKVLDTMQNIMAEYNEKYVCCENLTSNQNPVFRLRPRHR